MKILNKLTILAITTGFVCGFMSCKKDKDDFNAENMSGLWTMTFNSVNSGGSIVKVTLRNSGSAEFDVFPQDGVTDQIGSWTLNGNAFTLAIEVGGSNTKFSGILNPKTLSITGTLEFNNGTTTDTGTFKMDKGN